MKDFDLCEFLDILIRIIFAAMLFCLFLLMCGLAAVVIRAAFSGDLIAAIEMISRL